MADTREYRVYGPPGTGKTTYLARQAKRAGETYGASGVVIASLTRAAAAEVAGRDSGIPKTNVGTLHSHAFHGLKRPQIAESKEGLAEWNEHVGSPRDVLGKGKAFDPDNPPLEVMFDVSDADNALSQMNVYRQRMMPRELWMMPVRKFAAKWDDFKKQTNRFDFTDLIEIAIDNCPRHHLNPAAFFLDEAQDMSKLEWTLARQWGLHTQVFITVGDPWQNLYAWRGSDPEAFEEAEVSGTLILDQSYRVPAAVQKYAVDWISEIVGDRIFPEYKPRDEPGEVEVRPDVWNFPETLIGQFEEEIEKGRSVMLLASCAYMLHPMIAVLRERGIPFWNPYRTVNGAWNPLRYSDRLLAYLRPDASVWGEDARVWSLDDLDKWTDVLSAKDTMNRGAKSRLEADIAEIEASRFDKELVHEPVSLEYLQRMFKEDALDKFYDLDLSYLQSMARDSRRRILDYPIAVAERYGASTLKEEAKVIVGTIHSVKGGQADSVYVWPDLSWNGMQSMTNKATRDATYRQFYVAFTRARHKLVLLSPKGSDAVIFPRP